jgi:hypothetical protein
MYEELDYEDIEAVEETGEEMFEYSDEDCEVLAEMDAAWG